MYIIKNQIENHLKEHATIYVFMIILFLTGVIFGAIIVNSMNFNQKQDIFFYLERYIGQIIANEQVENQAILIGSFLYHIKYLLLLFLLGLTVIGLPLVWILIFIKGLVIGFSVGFIVNQLGMKGLLLATVSIAPQNVIIIPVYIIAGSFSMVYSLSLFHKLFSRSVSQPFLKPFIQYSVVFMTLIFGALFGSLIESYIANEAFKVLLQYTLLFIITIF